MDRLGDRNPARRRGERTTDEAVTRQVTAASAACSRKVIPRHRNAGSCSTARLICRRSAMAVVKNSQSTERPAAEHACGREQAMPNKCRPSARGRRRMSGARETAGVIAASDEVGGKASGWRPGRAGRAGKQPGIPPGFVAFAKRFLALEVAEAPASRVYGQSRAHADGLAASGGSGADGRSPAGDHRRSSRIEGCITSPYPNASPRSSVSSVQNPGVRRGLAESRKQ